MLFRALVFTAALVGFVPSVHAEDARAKAKEQVEFGMLLRQSDYRGSATYADASALARRFRGPDADGYRAEFVRLVRKARTAKGM